MRIILSPKAEKTLKRVHKIDQISLVKKLRSLKDSTLDLKKEKLAGYSSIIRIRVGHYRIVYRQKKEDIYIILISHRKNVYGLLKRLMG